VVSVGSDALLRTAGRRDDDSRASAELVERLVSTGYALALLAVGIQSVAHVANGAFFDDDIQAFNADDDASVFAWASSAVTFVAGFLVFLLWLLLSGHGRLLLVAAVLAFFSLDDMTRIHERVGTAVRSDVFGLPDESSRLLWPALFFPLLAVAFGVLWGLARDAPGRAGSTVRIGLLLLAAGVAAEVVTAPLYIFDEATGWPGRTEVVVEEGAELAGWILVATGLTCLLLEFLRRMTTDRARA
jgi:hypothetical protein